MLCVKMKAQFINRKQLKKNINKTNELMYSIFDMECIILYTSVIFITSVLHFILSVWCVLSSPSRCFRFQRPTDLFRHLSIFSISVSLQWFVSAHMNFFYFIYKLYLATWAFDKLKETVLSDRQITSKKLTHSIFKTTLFFSIVIFMLIG